MHRENIDKNLHKIYFRLPDCTQLRYKDFVSTSKRYEKNKEKWHKIISKRDRSNMMKRSMHMTGVRYLMFFHLCFFFRVPHNDFFFFIHFVVCSFIEEELGKRANMPLKMLCKNVDDQHWIYSKVLKK